MSSIQAPSGLYDPTAPDFTTAPIRSTPVTPTTPVARSNGTTPSGITTLSPWAKLLSRLQQLHQTDPAAFKGIVEGMADTVKTAADKASGDEKESLTRLGNQLAELAKTGDLPAFKPPKHRHHTHNHPASGGTMSLLQGLMEQIDHVLGPGATPVTAAT